MENENVVTKPKLNLRLLGFLLAYPMGYLYWELLFLEVPERFEFIGITIFSILFIIWSELILRGRKEKASKGTIFWYAAMVITAATSGLAPDRGISIFAVHLCAIYSVLFANGTLLGGRTGGLLPFDIINGVFIKGLGNFWRFFADPIEIFKARKELKGPVSEDDEIKKNNRAISGAAGVIVVIIAVIFFVIVLALLSSINEQFNDAVEKVFDIFTFDFDFDFAEIIVKLIMAGPVAVLLYGAISKCASSDGEEDRTFGNSIISGSKKLRVLKDTLINIILGCFILVYIIFFVFEGSYIFGAFFGDVPTGFNVVNYARNGFFELIWVMVINMLIFLLVNSFTKESSKTKLNKAFLITLMSTSMIFAVVSFVKLGFYFSRFGYTPKRILAMWGAIILLVAAALVIVSVIKNKSYTRSWIIFTVVSYLILCIISGVFQYNARKETVVSGMIRIPVCNESEYAIKEINMCVEDNMFDFYDLGSCSNASSNTNLIEPNSGFTYIVYEEDIPKNFLHGNYVVTVNVTYEGDDSIYSGEFVYDPSVDKIVLGDHYYEDYSYVVDLEAVSR